MYLTGIIGIVLLIAAILWLAWWATDDGLDMTPDDRELKELEDGSRRGKY